jgi:hypothetical protein
MFFCSQSCSIPGIVCVGIDEQECVPGAHNSLLKLYLMSRGEKNISRPATHCKKSILKHLWAVPDSLKLAI